MNKIYVFDIDNTICSEERTMEKIFATPKQNVIDVLNKKYDEGNRIILYTARSWDAYKATEYWLKTNGVKYHLLMCGKIIYDHWIDDRALNVKDINELD